MNIDRHTGRPFYIDHNRYNRWNLTFTFAFTFALTSALTFALALTLALADQSCDAMEPTKASRKHDRGSKETVSHVY